MKYVSTVLLSLVMLVSLGCSNKLEQSARDTAAGLQGALTQAQQQYQTTCTKDPTPTPCTVVNKAIDAQNSLITATEAYCGWTAGTNINDPSVQGTCAPVKTAQAGLQAAITNAQVFTTQLKGVLQ